MPKDDGEQESVEDDDEEDDEYVGGDVGTVEEDFQFVKDFLMQQNNLKVLEVRNGNFFKTPFLPDNIQLTELDLFIPHLSLHQMENMLTFVKTQNYIEQCLFNILAYTNRITKMMQTLYHIVQLPTLKSLSVVFYEGEMSTQWSSVNQVVNTNLHTLQLKPCIMGKSDLKPFIAQSVQMFPNVKVLDLSFGCGCDDFSTSAFAPISSLKKLEKLFMSHGKSRYLTSIKIPSLKELKMCALLKSRQIDWDSFLDKHPSLEAVEVQMCMDNRVKLAHKLASSLLKKLKRLENLHICTLHDLVTPAETESLDKLVEKHPTLQARFFNFCGKAPYEKVVEVVNVWDRPRHWFNAPKRNGKNRAILKSIKSLKIFFIFLASLIGAGLMVLWILIWIFVR